MTVVYDLLGVQSKEHGERGIARYVLHLAVAIESIDPDLVDIYLIRDDLPAPGALEPLIRTGKIRHAADLEIAPPRSGVYLVSSPFEMGESLDRILPVWARGSRWRRAGILYDLIPMVFPDRYLSHYWAPLYRARATTVGGLDHLLAISESTKQDGVELLGRPAESITVIAAGADERFCPPTESPDAVVAELQQRLPALRRSYLLFPSGIEWRKNIERMLDAYALLPPEVRRRHQLVLVCRTNDDERRWLAEQTRARGIDHDFLATGFVSDPDLVRLYQGAELVVFPSLYEGFGLPVLEARRCGAPVVCSNTSSLVEVQPDPSARFDPTDAADIAAVLQRTLGTPEELDRLRGSPIPPFTWEWAARKSIPVLRRLDREGNVVPRRARRLAVVSPLPPQRSGIADYTYRLLEPISACAEFSVFVDVPPEEVRAPAGVQVHHLDRLEAIERAEGQFDQIIYFLGNSEFHVRAMRELRRRPGLVLLHDGRMTGLYHMIREHDRKELPGETVGQFLWFWYRNRYRAHLFDEVVISHADADRFGILLLREIAALATGIYTHSRYAAELVNVDTGVRADILYPIPVPRLPPLLRDVDHRSTITTFGMVDPIKQPFLLIEAFAQIRRVHPEARLRFVGDIDAELHQRLDTAIARLDLQGSVELTGHVSETQYRTALAETTVAVQLRAVTNGESSAAAADLIGSGVPVVVSDLGAMAELPDDVVVHVPHHATATELAAILLALLDDPDRRREMVDAGLRYADAHGFETAARRLLEVLSADRSPARRPSDHLALATWIAEWNEQARRADRG